MVYLFHVVEKKTAKVLVLLQVRRNLLSFWIHSIKIKLCVSCISDRGSYFEQEKLIALDKEEQSWWENKTVSVSWLKIEDKGKDEPAEPDSQEFWQKLASQTIVAGNCLQENLVKSISCWFCQQMFLHAKKRTKYSIVHVLSFVFTFPNIAT